MNFNKNSINIDKKEVSMVIRDTSQSLKIEFTAKNGLRYMDNHHSESMSMIDEELVWFKYVGFSKITINNKQQLFELTLYRETKSRINIQSQKLKLKNARIR